MCLILAAWQAHPDFPLVIAANRDEFFARPTRAAGFWPESPALLAGRDLQAGGTWLGITRGGPGLRFAALTNYRDPAREKQAATSRGALVSGFLLDGSSTLDYLAAIEREAGNYNGFNLLVCDGVTLACHNNVERRTRVLAPGIHGLSNHVVNTPWPKVKAATGALQASLRALPDTDALSAFLRHDSVAADADLPSTGVSLDWERRLSAIFVRALPDAAYGTRSSTVLVVGRDKGVIFDEQEWNADASPAQRRRYRFELDRSGHGRPAS